MRSERFSETPYYEAYKTIRNKLRTYDPIGLIQMCLRYLHQPAAKPLDYLKRYPWCVMLLIKWILVDEKFTDRNRPTPTADQATNLLQQVVNLANKVRMPSEHDSVTIFIRAMVFQQVLYQRRSPITLISRQMLYFGGLDEAHYISLTFRTVTGMSLNRFLYLAQTFHTGFSVDNLARHRIGARWFSELQDGGGADINLFLGLLSAPILSIRKILLARDAKTIEDGRMPRSASEYTEQTPLIQTPLIPSGEEDYIVTDPYLLENCLGNFVYSTLRNYHVQDFMGHFGGIFENYVHLAVKYSGLEFRPENELKQLLGTRQGRNLVDFLIADGDAHVFVDAKAAEMNYRGTVTHDTEELAKLLDTSLLKAVKQANSVFTDLARLNNTDAVFKPRDRVYLITVTYAQMNIGNGRALADSVGRAVVEAQADPSGNKQIPIENMYFFTIDEFEQLVAQVAISSIGLVEALERAKLLDADPATSSFAFEQHLAKWGMAGKAPDYLVKKTTDVLDQIAASFKS